MNAVPRLALVLVLLLPAGYANAQANLPEPTRGKVLLLDNDRILEGDIEKINSQYRIRRSVGELWVPVERTKRLCKDIDESYEIMKKQINLKDPDERLRLARWCQLNGLKSHALNEAKTALDMRPDHAESLTLVQMLQRFAISSSPAMATQHPPPLPAPPAPKTQVATRQAFDVSNETFVTFATRVQPILANTCVSCHSQGKGGNFQLVRATDGGARVAAQTNLNAALEYVNFERPVLSPLLMKAVVAHGGATAAPVKGRQSPSFQVLQGWVDQLLAGNPHLKEIRQADAQIGPSISAKKEYFNELYTAPERAPLPPPAIVSPAREPGKDVKKSGEIVSRPTSRLEEKTPSATPNLPTLPGPTTPAAIMPPPPVGPRDPFDPAEFNSRPK